MTQSQPSKQAAVDRLCELVGHPPLTVGRGSTEPKRALTMILEALELPIDPRQRKPELGQAIAEAAGLEWGPECDARGTPSGGGDTVTLPGLNRLIEAVTILGQHPISAGDVDFGQPYRGRGPEQLTVREHPDEIQVDWDLVDQQTEAHARLERHLAEVLEARGLTPLSPSPGGPAFDVAWRSALGPVVAEGKSATQDNQHQQVRLALGQVLEYRFRLQSSLNEATKAIILLELPPSGFQRRMCGAAGVEICGPDLLAEALGSLLSQP